MKLAKNCWNTTASAPQLLAAGLSEAQLGCPNQDCLIRHFAVHGQLLQLCLGH